MQALIRSVGTKYGRPYYRRALHRMLNGDIVAVIHDDNNSGYGTGGDGTNVPKIFIYASTDNGATWALKATLSTSGLTNTESLIGSSAVDAGNNLHVVYRSNSASTVATYIMFTWASGNAFTAGTPATVYTATGTGNQIRRLDIDTFGVAGTNAVMAIAVGSTTSGSYKSETIVAVATGGGTPTIYVTANLHAKPTDSFTGSDPITITGLHEAPVGTLNGWALVYSKNMISSGDLGDELIMGNWDSSSHAFTVLGRQTLNTSGQGDRIYTFFYSNAKEVSLIGLATAGVWIASRWLFNGALTGFTNPIQPSYHSYNPQLFVRFGSVITSVTMLAQGVSLFGMQWYNNIAAVYMGLDGNGYLVQTAVFGSTSITWRDSYQTFDVPSLSQGDANVHLGGTNRNNNSDMGVIVMKTSDFNATGVYRAYYESFPLPTATGTLSSPTGTQQADFPNFVTTLTYGTQPGTAPKLKVKFQIASDALFTTSVTTFTPSDSTLVVQSLPGAGGRATVYTFSPSSRISAGLWYLRWAEIDEFGNTSAWSATKTFTLAHLPTAIGLTPDNDTYIPQIAGSVSLSWTFTDPVSDDFQAGYQVVITLTSDGSTVADTGTVVSGSQGAQVAVSSTYLDTELSWKVRVQDRDGEWGAYSTAATFLMGSLPAPTITSPANNAVLTTGQPTISWTPGIGGTKTEAKYPILITQGSMTVLDTGDISGAATGYAVPPGILHNLKAYTLSVFVTDSAGLKGSASVNFTTSYVLPASALAPLVFLYEYDKRGYVHIGWDSTNIDIDFYCWNIYRQAIGSSEIDLLASIPSVRSVYGYRDQTAAANTRYQYWITQTVSRSGDLVESATQNITTVTTVGTNYWLFDPLAQTPAVPIFTVTSDTWTDEHEEAVVNVLGRGRHVEQGDHLGFSGSLNAQLRDKYIALAQGYNWLSNPSLLYRTVDTFNPDNWTLSGVGTIGTLVQSYDSFLEPCPNGSAVPYAIYTDTITNGGLNYWQITAARIDRTKTDIPASGSVAPAIWLAQAPTGAHGLNVSVAYTWLAADGTTVVTTGVVGATQVDTYEPAGSGDASTGNWKRWGATIAVPATGVYLNVGFIVGSASGTGSMKVWIGGCSLNAVTTTVTYLQYFDGDQLGCIYVTSIGGASYSAGTYLARQQRIDITEMKELVGRGLYLRNPFGDLLYVSLGDIDNTRIAGMGSATDPDDITIPYREIAF